MSEVALYLGPTILWAWALQSGKVDGFVLGTQHFIRGLAAGFNDKWMMVVPANGTYKTAKAGFLTWLSGKSL